MSDFDPYAYVAQSAPAATTAGAPAAFDPYAYVAKGAGNQPETPTPQAPSGPTPLPQTAGNPEGELLTGFAKGVLMPMAGGPLSGLRGIWDIAMGKGGQQAAQDIQSTQQAFTPEATTQAEKAGIEAAQSNWNPLNWPGLAASKAGEFLGKEASEHGASPGISTLVNILPTAAMSALPVAGMLKGGEAAEAGEAANAAGSAETATETAGNVPKTSGAAPEIPKAQTVEDTTPEQRQAILEKVGLKSIRSSAVSGNVGDAATDYQMTRYDQPAGRAMAAQFEHERNALADHATGIVESTGGTVGMDEDALGNRGATIDRPFSMARDYFKNQTRQLYSIADQRAQGVPVTLNNFMQTLQDDSHMTNQDRVALRGAIGAYARKLGMMDEKGQGIQGTVQNAETMRKFLSGNWTYQNSGYVSALKNAIDQDVTGAAGQDIYQQARAIHALKATILDDPNGVSKLFDVDPNTPINRRTPLAQIPGQLTNLSAEQFGNIINILKQMPDEIQPAAQSAIGEIKAQMANKLLQAGTKSGSARPLWNARAVTDVLKNNASKFRLAFADDPEALDKIDALNKAGQILKVDASYPGADAQAANAMKRGLISRVIAGGTRMGGAAAGSWFGPFGAAGGEAVGGALGESLGFKAAEKAALREAKKRIIPVGGG